MVIKVYHKDGTYFYPHELGATDISDFSQEMSMVEGDTVSLDFESTAYMPFLIGDYIEVFSQRYYLNQLPDVEKLGSKRFSYKCVFEGALFLLRRTQFMNIDQAVDIETSTANIFTTEFSLTGNAEFFIQVICYNMDRLKDETGYNWSIGTTYTETDVHSLDFSGENCLSVLQRICEEYNIEFAVNVVSASVINLNIFAAGNSGRDTGLTLKHGRFRGLYNLERKTVDTSDIITILYAYGAAKNISSDYRGYSPRLKLPGNEMSYISDPIKVALYGHREGCRFYDDIYPYRQGSLSSIGTIGTTYTEVYDDDMPFDLNATSGGETLYIIAGLTPKMHFNSGYLAGYEFDISSYDHATKKFRLISFKDDRGQLFPDPNALAFQPKADDEYVLLDIRLPQFYVDAAETRLSQAANADYLKLSQPQVVYDAEVERQFIKDNISALPGGYILPGDRFTVIDTQFSINKVLRVVSLKRNVFDEYEYTFELVDYVRRRKLPDINKAVKLYNGALLFNLFSPTHRSKIFQTVNILNKIVSGSDVNRRSGFNIALSAGSNIITFNDPEEWETTNYYLDVKLYNSSGDSLYWQTPPINMATGFSIEIPSEFTDVFIAYLAIK